MTLKNETKKSMKYSIKILNDGQKALSKRTKNARKFMKIIRTINWKNTAIEVTLRLVYGRKEDCFGEMETFDNEGEYNNKADFDLALEAFRREEQEWK